MENKTKRIFKYDYVVQNEQIKPAVIQKKMDGEVVDNVGVYDKQFFPNSFFKFRPGKSLKTGMVLLETDPEKLGFDFTLNDVVPSFGFTSKENKFVSEADVKIQKSDFWDHEDLFIKLFYSGGFLDSSNPKEAFWIAAMMAHPGFWFKGIQKRPENLKNVMFVVYDKNLAEKKVSKSSSDSGVSKVIALTKALSGLGESHKKLILSNAGLPVFPKMSVDQIDNTIIETATILPDKAVFTGETFDAYLNRMLTAENDVFKTQYLVGAARSHGLFERSDSNFYVFEGVSLGKNYLDVEKSFMSAENIGLLKKLEAKIDSINKKKQEVVKDES